MTQWIIEKTVQDWLTQHQQPMVLVAPDTSLLDILKQMLAADCLDAYVVEDNHVLGHLSFNNLVNHLFTQERPIHTHRQLFARISADAGAEELMDPHFAYCRPDEQINQVLHRLLQVGVSDLIVLAPDDSPMGVVKLTQLIRESLQ